MNSKTILLASVLSLSAAFAHAEDSGDAEVIDKGFAAMDLDKDGSITKPEFATYMTDYLAKQRAEFDNGFDALDADKDGKISKEESSANSALEANFEQIDEDGDGFLTKEDLRAAMQAAQEAAQSE